MITMLFLNVFTLVVGMIFYFFPVVSIASIPVIGSSVSSTLSVIMGYWNSLLDTLPYLQVTWTVFLVVIIPFEIGLLLLRFFLGHRSPVQ